MFLTVNLSTQQFQVHKFAYSILGVCLIQKPSISDSVQGNSRRIVVDGKFFTIRTILGLALLHLRLQEAPRALWVDALCISMNDLEERSAQVQRMSDI